MNGYSSFISYLWNGTRVITNTAIRGIGPSFEINTYNSIANWINYNGYTGFAGAWNIWRDPTYGWVASQLAIGTPVIEYWQYTDPDHEELGGKYMGDAFYTGSFAAIGSSSSWVARGSLRGTTQGAYSGDPLAITTKFYRYTTDESGGYGKFTGTGGESGEIYLGVPQWTYDGNDYPRSANTISGKYTYGEISWNTVASKYVLGVYGSEDGWHQSSTYPTIGQSWTLLFAKPEGSEATGSNIILTWDKWVLGESTTDIYVCRAAKWGA